LLGFGVHSHAFILAPWRACVSLAGSVRPTGTGSYLARPFEHKDSPDAAFERRERRFSAACDGFDVHCAVRIAADDDQGRERLVRYCSRPAFALDRIELLPEGRIAYLLKTPRRGRTHRVMSPMEFTARLAALIPPPPALSARSLAHAEPTVRVEPTLISVLPWGRLLEGELFAPSRYVEWAVLLKRSFGFDALRCPRCERRMRVLSTITDSAVVRRLLDPLNSPRKTGQLRSKFPQLRETGRFLVAGKERTQSIFLT
jgi:hypothetical protein